MYGVYWPALVPNDAVEQGVVLDNGDRMPVPPAPAPRTGSFQAAVELTDAPITGRYESVPSSGAMRAPLGTVAGARSGDKGGNANVGVWVESDAAYQWLSRGLTVEKFKELLPETMEYDVQRFELPNIRALNFVVHGLLGEGVAAGTRQDPQAKGLGEWLRARHVNIPVALVEGEAEGRPIRGPLRSGRRCGPLRDGSPSARSCLTSTSGSGRANCR